MIRASVSETKNRLSHFLRLVRGGEEVEIMDRDTPVARIVHVSRSSETNKKATWVMEAIRLGLIAPPQKKELSPDFFNTNKILLEAKGVLQALLRRERRDDEVLGCFRHSPVSYYCFDRRLEGAAIKEGFIVNPQLI